MRKALWVMLVLATCLGLATGASAQVPLPINDNFDYGDGALLTANGWIAHSGAGTQPIDVFSPGLAYTGYPSSSVIGQAARLDNNGEDAYRPFDAVSSGTIYYAFLLNVATPTAGYFAMLNASATSFVARVSVGPGTGGMILGISNTSTAPASSTVYALNTTHLIVVKFDIATGFAYMFVNPSLNPCVEPAPTQTSATAVTGFVPFGVALRQYAATQVLYLDGLRIGSTWADVVCGAPATGACCAPDGTCSPQLQADCLAAGGVYQGDGTSCSPNPCPQLGTCCLNGNCTFVLQANCIGAWTVGGACDPNPCVVPTGSCCAADGTCTVTTQVACLAPSTWTLDGVCVPNTCAQPTGSCCDPLGNCTVTEQASCLAGSTWTMFGVCVPNTCAQPTGACCLPAGTCVMGTEADCAGVGAYQGNFTTCTPNPCAAPVRTLCEVAEDDASGVALLLGQRVTVQGIALCDGMTWSTTIREFQITDGNCCIDVFGGTLLPTVALGDLVEVTGTVANFNGKTEISTPDMTVTVISSGNPIPAPGVTTTGALAAAGEPFESCLFTVHCVSIVGGDPWPALGANANVIIDDGSGPVVMRIDKDTNIDGTPAPVGPFTVIGVGDQFDITSPYDTGWQIKPRMLADIVLDCATGACCFPNGSCAMSTAGPCVDQGGTYYDGGTCTPNTCPPPVGACCFVTGVCEILNQAACGSNQWLGFGSVCLPDNPCEQPSGSCCYLDGSCIAMPQAPCTGVWTMFGVCVPNTCAPPPPPEGSCCYLDGTCAVTIEANCTATWLLNGVCVPNTCQQPPVMGACCNEATGACTITTEADCLAPLVWRGANVPCNAETCTPPVPTERTSWGQIKNLYR